MRVSIGDKKKRFTDDDRSGLPLENATKGEWRTWAGAQSLSKPSEASSVIAYHLAAWIPGGSSVLSFLPMNGEVDLTELERLHLNLAVTRTPDEGWLTVHPWDAPREVHKWGFENPTAESALFDDAIDVALVPGAAFDVVGRRLGHGKGYYDELLPRLGAPLIVGVCPSHLVVPSLPHEDHDVLMTHLATESGVQELRTDEGVLDG